MAWRQTRAGWLERSRTLRIQVLFDLIDIDGSREIEFNELLQVLDGAPTPEEVEAANEAAPGVLGDYVSLRESLHHNASKVAMLFDKWDKDHSGDISIDEFVDLMPLRPRQLGDDEPR